MLEGKLCYIGIHGNVLYFFPFNSYFTNILQHAQILEKEPSWIFGELIARGKRKGKVPEKTYDEHLK